MPVIDVLHDEVFKCPRRVESVDDALDVHGGGAHGTAITTVINTVTCTKLQSIIKQNYIFIYKNNYCKIIFLTIIISAASIEMLNNTINIIY